MGLGKFNMRFLLLLFLLTAGNAFAASPAFTDFDPTQFSTNGNKIAVKDGAAFTNSTPTNLFNTGQFTRVNGTNINLASGLIVTNLQSDNQIRLGTNGVADIFLARESSNIFSIRTPTGTNVFRMYGQYTDAANNNLLDIGYPLAYGGSIAAIRAYKNGSVVAPELYIDVPASKSLIFSKNNGNTTNWKMDNTGHFLPGTDNTYDIGASGASRPRTVYAGTSFLLPINGSFGFVSSGSLMYGTSASLLLRGGTAGSIIIQGAAGASSGTLTVPGTVSTTTITGNDGISLGKTITAPGTTGAQTINKATGRVNFAAAATSLVVTCSLVDANSIITAIAASNDTTGRVTAVVPGAGSFTIYAIGSTAEMAVNFRITN